MRCRHCRVALWSHYPGGGNAIAFVRVIRCGIRAISAGRTHLHFDQAAVAGIACGANAYAEF